MQFGIIKERKNPPDRRVVFSPEELVRLQKEYPEATIKVESSDIRVFNDEAYKNLGIEVAGDISDCDVNNKRGESSRNTNTERQENWEMEDSCKC